VPFREDTNGCGVNHVLFHRTIPVRGDTKRRGETGQWRHEFSMVDDDANVISSLTFNYLAKKNVKMESGKITFYWQQSIIGSSLEHMRIILNLFFQAYLFVK